MPTDSDRPAANPPANPSARALQGLAQADSFEVFARATTLIDETAAAGDPDALCVLAMLEAVGAGRLRDWNRALDALGRAAEAGSEPARDQLRLLARDTSIAADNWREARNRIRIEQLLRAPAPVAVSDRPRLRRFPGFATEAECRWLIERLGPKLKPALVWNPATGQGVVDDYRSNQAAELRIDDMDVVVALIRARMSSATQLPEFIFEVPQLMHYAVGEEFRPHHDYLDPARPGLAHDIASRGQRMGTFLLFLNDDFEGGETEFPEAGIKFRGRTGDGLFFANVTADGRPDPLTLHAGRSPTRGEKWILSQWIRDRAPSEQMVAGR